MHFRLSDEHIAILTKYQTDHKLANMTEALEQILLSPFSKVADSELASGASDLFPCNQRLELKDQLYCVVPASLSRTPKIGDTSREICNICQSIRKNLPATAKMTQTQTETADSACQMTAPGESLERNRDPSDSTRKNAGMLWCPEGLWVFANKCDKCRELKYSVWYECQKEKLRQKGEQARQPI
jgi:hypothetical protein